VRPTLRRPRFLRNGKATAGALIILFFTLLAVIGPWINPYSPDATGTSPVAAPSGAHWFGTDQLGRDIYSQLLVGTRGVIVVGFAAGAIATALSLLIGIASGYLPGRGGETLSVLSNVFLVLPALPLLIIITSAEPKKDGWIVVLTMGSPRGRGTRGCCARRRSRCAAATSSRPRGPPANRPGGSSPSRSCRTSPRSSPPASSAPWSSPS
jgi:ABC-type dipeptide/oligopeptide/nickel transport system permease subunit